MPTADEAMAEALLPGSHKSENRFQGRVRVGPLDLVQLRYSIAAAGGPGAFDGLAVTWFDQIQVNGSWRMCDRYQNALDPAYFTPSGEIQVRFGEDDVQLAHQQSLGEKIRDAIPIIAEHKVSRDASRDELFALCAGMVLEKTGVPVRMVSFGPTERDKLCK
jgi:hypothetical protein